MELPSLIQSLTLIDDRRNNKNKRYPLPLLLLIAFCASISKHDSWYTMQDYALAHEASIRELYKQLFGEELEHVTPSHDTLKIVPSKSHSPQGLQGGLSKLWIVDLLQWDEQTRQICIDGKTMRGVKKLSPDTESHIVSAYDPHLQLVLSMDAVPVKRNELDAIRRLLDELDVTDALITIDAIGCQHDVAAQVLEAGGDYVLQVKGNQPTLLQELEDSFPNISKGYTVNKEEGLEHGRIEHRQMKSVVLSPEMLDDSYAFKDWAGIKSIHRITRKRYDKRQGKETTEMSYYISSISSIIYKTKRGYERAFLYTEYDDNDLTYFILYHLRTIRQALERLKDYLRRKATENNDAHRLMSVGNMNSRQAQMVQILREKPDMMFTVREIEQRFAVTNATARTDLKGLVERGFLVEVAMNKVKRGYVRSADFEARVVGG